MNCSNCQTRIAEVPAVDARVNSHHYPFCSLNCLNAWCAKSDLSRLPTPASWTISPVVVRERGVKPSPASPAPSPDAPTRGDKIRAWWARLTPKQRAKRTAKARAALAAKKTERRAA